MALAKASELAAASALHGYGPVGVLPDAGDPDAALLQAAGWGAPNVGATAEAEAAAILHFVYRRRRRLRAKKLTLGV